MLVNEDGFTERAIESERASVSPGRVEVFLQTDDEARIRLEHFQPVELTGVAVLLTPAMGAPVQAYRRIAQAMADRGHAVAVLEPRGVSGSELEPTHGVAFGVREFLDHDWRSAVAWARTTYPSAKLVLFGHSFGGQLNSGYAGKYPEEVDALVNLCAVWVHFRELGSPLRQMKGLIFFTLMRVAAEILGYGPGDRLGWGARFSKQHVRDWSSWGMFGRYRYRGGDLRGFLHAVRQPTLAISFTDDEELGPKQACDRFCAEMPEAKTTRWHLRPASIDRERVGHFGALKDADLLWNQIDVWMRQNVIEGSLGNARNEESALADESSCETTPTRKRRFT